MRAEIPIREMQEADLPAAIDLWHAAEGVTVTAGDSPSRLAGYLRRNPRLSHVAERDRRIVGAVLGGHDGRRGYLHHLAVHPSDRRVGLGRRLVEAALVGLREAGIEKVHVFLEAGNPAGREFWTRIGWADRTDLRMISWVMSPPEVDA